MSWTEERVEQLRTMIVDQKFTDRQCAQRLGVSRNTIVGKRQRMNLECNGDVQGNPSHRSRSPEVRERQRQQAMAQRLGSPKEASRRTPFRQQCPPRYSAKTGAPIASGIDPLIPPTHKIFDTEAAPLIGAVDFERLKDNQCRWPFDDGSQEMRYCGLKIIKGHYCADHAPRVYVKSFHQP